MKILADIGDDFFGGAHPLNKLTGVGSLVSLVLNLAFVVAAVILLFFVVVGGIGLI